MFSALSSTSAPVSSERSGEGRSGVSNRCGSSAARALKIAGPLSGLASVVAGRVGSLIGHHSSSVSGAGARR